MLEVEADDYVPEKPIKHGKLLSQKKAEVRDKAEDPARNGKKSIQTQNKLVHLKCLGCTLEAAVNDKGEGTLRDAY